MSGHAVEVSNPLDINNKMIRKGWAEIFYSLGAAVPGALVVLKLAALAVGGATLGPLGPLLLPAIGTLASISIPTIAETAAVGTLSAIGAVNTRRSRLGGNSGGHH